MKKYVIVVSAFLFFSGCSHQQLRSVDPHERTLYEHGIGALASGDNISAQDFFTKLLQEYPTTRWLSSGYYNLGASLENQGKYAEAAEQYKKVIDYYQGVHSREEAEALYRLSICYEAMGDDQKVVLSLLQLKDGLRFLDRQIAEGEWPSRLAGAYARQGLADQAQSYYTQAQAGLKKERQHGSLDQQRWLPKTYYSMGHIPEGRLKFQNNTEFEGFLMSLENSQTWLMKAAQAKVSPWSENAEKEIVSNFTAAWNYIDRLPPENNGDAMLMLKKKQETQRAFATRLDTVLQNMKTEKNADFSKTEAFAYMKDLQKRIDLLIGGRDIQDQPTDELKARQSGRQRGRMKK